MNANLNSLLRFWSKIGLSLKERFLDRKFSEKSFFEKKYNDLEKRYLALRDDYNILLSLYVKLLEEYLDSNYKQNSLKNVKK